jgi:lysophosphatidate acyltransferase
MLLPFKKGAFHLALQAGADVLPVVAENYSKVLNLKAKRFNAGTIRVKGTYHPVRTEDMQADCLPVLDPISTKGMTPADVSKFSDDTRNKMLQALIEMAADKESLAVKTHAS